MSDEARLLKPEEARIRKTLRNKRLAERTRVKLLEAAYDPDIDSKLYRFSIKTPKSEVIANVEKFGESKNKLYVASVFPTRETRKKIAPGSYSSTLSDTHSFVKNKVLSTKEIRQALTTVGKMFPTIDTVVGKRVTGAKALYKGVPPSGKKSFLQSLKIPKSGKVGKALGLGAAAYQAYKGMQEN